MIVTIDDMRSRGKAGYVARILSGGEKQFIHPIERTGYSTSRQQLTFQLTEDGIYEVCDANFGSSKRNIYFVLIENSEERDRADTLAQLLVDDEKLELPELEGSQKQIDWAQSIRTRFVAALKQAQKDIPDWVTSNTSAKFWIDNRTKLGSK